MAPNSLYPCSAEIFYRTPNAPHSMTIPLLAWSPISVGHPAGTNLNWNGVQTDTFDMLDNFVDTLLPFWGTGTTFSHFEVSTYATPTSPKRPVATSTMTGKVGTGATPIPAAQATFNFKTTDFGTFKIVMLDAKVSSTFQPLEALVSPANDAEIAVRDYLIDPEFAFSGRDGFQPSLLKRITYTLNEQLRASYHLD